MKKKKQVKIDLKKVVREITIPSITFIPKFFKRVVEEYVFTISVITKFAFICFITIPLKLWFKKSFFYKLSTTENFLSLTWETFYNMHSFNNIVKQNLNHYTQTLPKVNKIIIKEITNTLYHKGIQ